MLIFKNQKFIKSSFESEAELERVIIDNYEYLFGPDSFYLPKAKIKTADGVGTIPDGFAIDIREKRWYIVEAELGHHDVWNHIAKQVSKQIVASQQLETKRILEDISAELYSKDDELKDKFDGIGIKSVNVRKVIRDILETDPIIGIPIDSISDDLKDWARQQRHKVKLWIVNKFVEMNKSDNIVYEFPEEFKPALDTTEERELTKNPEKIAQYDVELIDLVHAKLLKTGEQLMMVYTPRNGTQKQYKATIMNDGTMKLKNQLFNSPSYAALVGIQDAGSNRKTVNGWISWKTNGNLTLAKILVIHFMITFRGITEKL